VAWAVGDEGTILKSSDAGQTWGVQSMAQLEPAPQWCPCGEQGDRMGGR
jgi:photosystem II stability/assembly factor-like uncharacterized protein